ncbi:sigma-70 family RNA polymerase sigma factor [Clostridium aciditolerans]|uniref:Sigma-70 family RNA polymerase sigma factor n=1 Tax=Clostridium aciditolerans TaxID=339861 RepID=A0A934M919_9CLOT|nr:sigma-70 family RNA polymerase sigma factor [Clostridium aciditolerans]MBI6875401.1 sigma-70 family RNA polymerase sigma factor [Clostridium aciditolerans]
MGINEDNFIRELNNKNPKALEYAFNSYCDYIYNVVFGVFGSEQYSTYIDECINDIFMCLWNNIESFDEEKGSFKYWFKAVAKYKAINYKKKIIKDANIECIEDYMVEAKNQVEDLIISKENKGEVVNAIKELKEIDREIFMRRYLIQEDIVDIARYLGIDRSIVDNRLSRGRKILKEKLTFLKKGGCINE